MSLPFAAFTFINAWWIMMFFVLAFRPSFKRALIINTLLAAAVTLGLYFLINSGLVPLRDVH
ncbi:MAG: hypothetical protein KGJ06_01940 [Pseudomonadota bacterium]|nr:hypothetical protein [Pseudomonadota bacterium]